MNLFKVFASGKKKFPEEVASAFLAWIINPYMEHGLGYTFLQRFLRDVIDTKVREGCGEEIKGLEDVLNRLEVRLRSSSTNELDFKCHLEKWVGNAAIDIVLQLDNWWLAIENKIYKSSVQPDHHQLATQYKCLRKELDEKESKGLPERQHIVSIYLSPEPMACAEIECANVSSQAPGDSVLICTWKQDDSFDGPCIESMIRDLLLREQMAEIEPLSEYLRHTLRSLCLFINNGFEGYAYDSPAGSSGINPATEEVLPLNRILERQEGFVGIMGALPGLILQEDCLSSRTFQYTKANMQDAKNWVDIETFKKVVRWLKSGEKININWPASLPTKLPALAALRIGRDYPDLYVGVKGGKKALEAMAPEEIPGKRWGIASEPRSSAWIAAPDYAEVLGAKGF